jgi:8-amino-7-oxononanoate synthase
VYQRELEALKRSNRLRTREVYSDTFIDLASNDYLGLSENEELFDLAYKRVKSKKYHSPCASMLVNGYHQVHKEFEEYISDLSGFDESLVVGSGYLANIALIESLVRRGDILILDSHYHASGVMASKMVSEEVFYFEHNCSTSLNNILKSKKYNRAIVCVEGIYSMSGDILSRDIVDICDKFGAILIVDEAHSSGVLGDRLLGIFDYYEIEIKSNYIKMATLGKAIGSYGAYIQASSHIIEYLLNRAKPIIYSTAPSLFDIALAHEGYRYIQEKRSLIKDDLDCIKKVVKEIFDIDLYTPILKIDVDGNQNALLLKEWAREEGFLIGAIRPPTVHRAILRVILRLNIDRELLRDFLLKLKLYLKSSLT